MQNLPLLRSGKKGITQGSRSVRLLLVLAPLALFFTFVPWAGHTQQAHAATISCPAQIQDGSTDASSGGLVSKLQRELNALDVANLSVDGQFGANTKAAVEHFQQDAFPSDSSQWDGQVGPHTWGALGQCHSSGGVTGGGCNTSPNGAEACISWSSGTVIPDGYLRASDISFFQLTRIINGSVEANPCVMLITGVGIGNGYHIASSNCHIAAGSTSGDSYVSVIRFGFVDTNDGTEYNFIVVSPVQYV